MNRTGPNLFATPRSFSGAGLMVSSAPVVKAGIIASSSVAGGLCTSAMPCRKQTSITAGTIFASSKLALRLWFKAMYLLTQSKKGISSIELGRRLGVVHLHLALQALNRIPFDHDLGELVLESPGGGLGDAERPPDVDEHAGVLRGSRRSGAVMRSIIE